jgi:hypothetical protein
MFQDWQSFYILIGTSAATLVGLMFVALSVGSRAITPKDLPALRVFVSPTVVHFLYVLVTSAVVMFPTLPRAFLGTVLVLAGLASFGRALIGLPVMRRSHPDIHDWVWYLLVPSVSYLLFVGTGIGLLLQVGQAASGLAVATLLLLLTGVRNAWDLVIFRVLPEGEPSGRESRLESPGPGEGAAMPEPTTSERRADPGPRPAPRADAAPRQSLALSPAQQGDVARVIEEAGVKSGDLTWALQPSRYAMIGPPVSALVHTPTGCFFRFEFTKDADGDNRKSVFVPGKGAREVTKAAASWADQLEQVRDWLTHLGS